MEYYSKHPLTGKSLLSKLKELSSLSKAEKAKACGYYSLTKAGSLRANLSGFMDAILIAEGINLDGESSDRRGRGLTYRVTVHANGAIVIGKSYTEQMDLKPGDEFEIKLGYKHIHLIKIEPEEDDE